MLIAAAASRGLHVSHPEVIGIRADDMNGLAKAQLDLESIAVELEHLQGLECRIRGQQEYGSAHRVVHDTEAHDAPDRSPHQVEHAVADRDIALAINRTGGADEGRVVLGEIFEANLVAVDFWSPLATTRRLGCGQIGHCVALGAREQLMSVGQKRRDDFAAGVVGVGNEQHLAVPGACYRKQQRHELVQKRSGIPAGKHQTFEGLAEFNKPAELTAA